MALIECPDCGKNISDSAPACIGCGRPMTQGDYKPEEILPPELLGERLANPDLHDALPEGMILASTAYKKAVTKDQLGTGCLLQALGLFLGIVTLPTVIGPILGFALFIFGGRYSRDKRYICSKCGNEVFETSTICSACQNKLQVDPSIQAALKAQVTFLIISCCVLICLTYFYNP